MKVKVTAIMYAMRIGWVATPQTLLDMERSTKVGSTDESTPTS